MTAIRFPILLSLGLHGLAVAVLSLVPFGAKAVFQERHEISVELVEPDRPQVVEAIVTPTPPELVLPKTPRSEKRVVRHPVSRLSPKSKVPPAEQTNVRQSISDMTNAVELSQPPMEIPIPLSRSEPIPAFIEVPPNFGVTVSTGTKAPDPRPTSEPEVGASVVSLLETGILPPVKRPVLQTTSVSSHLLRDPTPDTADKGRSKVKLGDNLRPDYPRSAREAGWEGTVMLRVEVLPGGNAGSVAVHKSSGHSILDEAAITAVQRWQFTPAMDGNFPIHSVVHLPVKFDLKTPY
jgi:protein TonB